MLKSNWLRLGFLNTRKIPRILFILLCVSLVAPLAYFAWTYTQSDSLVQDLPRGSLVTKAYANFSHVFGSGFTYPTTLILKSRESVISPEFFQLSADIVGNITNSTGGLLSEWQGVVLPQTPFSANTWFELFERCELPKYETLSICRGINYASAQLLAPSGNATLLVFASSKGEFEIKHYLGHETLAQHD